MLRGVSCCCCLNSKSMLPLIFFNYFNKALKRVWLGRPSEKAFRSSAESLSLVLLSRSHVILTWKLWWQCLPVVTWFASFDFNSRWVSQEELACDPSTEHHSLCWVDSVIVILWNSPLQLIFWVNWNDLIAALRVCVFVLVTELYLTLCNLMDYRPPGSSVHGILQARILEWVAIPFSRESSWPRDETLVFCVSCNGWWILY